MLIYIELLVQTPVTLFQRDVSRDKRFTKSQKPGILYEASSYSYIDDETLIGYGFKERQWERSKKRYDNIVTIKTLDESVDSLTKTVDSLVIEDSIDSLTEAVDSFRI